MVLLLVFMQLTRDLFAIAKFLLKRSYRFGFTRRLFTFAQIAERADRTLFASGLLLIQTIVFYSIHQLLPPAQPEYIHLRVEANPTHCLLVRLICLRTVLILTNAYLV